MSWLRAPDAPGQRAAALFPSPDLLVTTIARHVLMPKATVRHLVNTTALAVVQAAAQS